MFNAKGDLSLEGFFHYVKYLSEELKKQIVNRYPKTKNSVESKLVLEELMKHSLKLQEFENSLNNKLSETKASILSLQSKLCKYLMISGMLIYISFLIYVHILVVTVNIDNLKTIFIYSFKTIHIYLDILIAYKQI